ncbi:MAG: MoaD/ThiS family protein [Betaproteobacteria bacterium]|nr:MoaD/ThiS family protein [Betaproteobacteria bacterium]
MKVYIPDALRSYTGDRRTVAAQGATLAALLMDLDRQFPGIRFRMIDEQDAIRRHMRVFVNGNEALGTTLKNTTPTSNRRLTPIDADIIPELCQNQGQIPRTYLRSSAYPSRGY